MPSRTLPERHDVVRALERIAWKHGRKPTSQGWTEPKCYVAGPMTGLPEFNVHSFRRATLMLRDAGWHVFDPTENDKADGIELEGTTGHEEFSYKRAMMWDLARVCESEAVFVLPGWQESKGANLELRVAHDVGTAVYSILSGRQLEELPTLYELAGRPAPPPFLGLETQPGAPLEPTSLPSGSQARKDVPMATGVLDYFPAAIAEVARVSKAGNDKHNPGQPMHWARGKSMDHADCVMRHLADRGHLDPEDGLRHSAKAAWRALALLQQELEDAGEAPLSRGSREEAA